MQHSSLLLSLATAATLLLSGCGGIASQKVAQKSNFQQVYQNISSEELKQHTKTLSSDEFEGRLPTTVGEKKTLNYLLKHFKALGYQPGNGDSFLQSVELIEMNADPDMSLTIGSNQFVYKKDMVASTKREQSLVELKDSEVVFVGYGVVAPEYDWNDYEGLDVKGKTVVILVNDPGFADPDSGKFQGKTMTYYGRWTYKYEEASRQGARAALIVHETAPASYGWSVVANSWSGPQYGLVTANGNAERVAVEGWLSVDAAQQVFTEAGMSFEVQKALAAKGSYHTSLGLAAAVTVKSTMKKSISNNVIATLPGASAPDEHIIYSSHWDHLGKDESKKGDQIYNGAHDNATGLAASLVMAKAFADLKPAPERSITFLMVTAEEQGLLGSSYYASNPIIPLNKTVANLNMDALNLLGKTKDVAVVGMGKSELELNLATAAQRQDRILVREDFPQAGYYYRSDHFSFAKQGVPALYAKGGSEPLDEETAQYRKRAKVIITGCYHQVCDQFRENWDFSGMHQDTQLLFDVGQQIANSQYWPKWNASSEFQRK
jgi:Zn-dependent M28 family amino/carboxypeptidase